MYSRHLDFIAVYFERHDFKSTYSPIVTRIIETDSIAF